MVKVEVVGRRVLRLKNGEVLAVEVPVAAIARVEREKEGVVRIVDIENVEIPEVVMIVSRQCREEGVELVVGLFINSAVVHTEYLVELTTRLFENSRIAVINDDGE